MSESSTQLDVWNTFVDQTDVDISYTFLFDQKLELYTFI